MKRVRRLSSSDESDHGSNSTCWSQHSQTLARRSTGMKASEVFRTDLITAMKVHDSQCLSAEDFYVLADPWRQDWEKGVQVPVSPQSLPKPIARVVCEPSRETSYTRPKKLVRLSGSEALGYVDIRTLADAVCRYDLNEDDQAWLLAANQELREMGLPLLDEITMETVMEEFERHCHDNMSHAVQTEEGLGIEYDDDVVCEVCHSPDGEDNNEMVFCDKCNICVHQACYGIQKVPEGSWLCRTCALGLSPRCQLCPQRGGAMKPTRSGTKWAHVSCALWIPEVSIGNPEKMEPITNVSHIPSSRWALLCCVCRDKTGACIQCSAKNCRVAFHVTCGLKSKLKMITFLTEEDEVKFKSFCPKHSGPEEEEGEEGEEGGADKRSWRRGRVRGEEDEQEDKKRGNLRQLKLQQLEEEFPAFVAAEEVAERLRLSAELVDFLFQYWKLKRKANFNQPLLTPKKEEEESLARREQEVLLRRLQLFTHLRQDLERVRNLSYMVTRREKMKRSLCRLQEQMFHKQLLLLEQLSADPSATDPDQNLSEGSSSSTTSSTSSTTSTTTTSSSSSSSSKGRRLRPDRRTRGRSSPASPPHGAKGSGSRSTRQPAPDQNQGAPPEGRRGPGGRGSPVPEAARRGGAGEEEEEEEGRRRRKASEGPAPRRLDKTVCVRLVDIRLLHLPPGSTCSSTCSTTCSQLKNWGKFRIPKRAERPPPSELLSPEAPRPRLRSGAAPTGAPPTGPGAEPGGQEAEPSPKRCHSHQLRRDATLGRRYGNHIIRQGVLAS